MKVAYRGQLDAIDQWLRDINNKLTMGISARSRRKNQTRVPVLQPNAPWNRR